MIQHGAFEGLLGFATLHPLLTLGPVLIAVVAAVLASRRRSTITRARRRR